MEPNAEVPAVPVQGKSGPRLVQLMSARRMPGLGISKGSCQSGLHDERKNPDSRGCRGSVEACQEPLIFPAAMSCWARCCCSSSPKRVTAVIRSMPSSSPP